MDSAPTENADMLPEVQKPVLEPRKRGKVIRPMTERFWEKVDKSAGVDGCWLWANATDIGGYGVFGLIENGVKVLRKTHRIAWELTNGSIGKGLFACHRCDVRRCVNPAHIFLGSMADNNADKAQKGRAARLRGEASPLAKLSWDIVSQIRASTLKDRVWADLLNVSRPSITMIRLGRTWREPDNRWSTAFSK